MASQSILKFEPVYRPRTPWARGCQVPLRKDPSTAPQFILYLCSSLLQKDLFPFMRVTVHWGKGNNHSFGELLDTGPELTLILKHYCGPPVILGAYGHPMMNGALAQIHFIMASVIFPVWEWVIGIDIVNNWQNPHTDSTICGVGTIMMGKARWKPADLLYFTACTTASWKISCDQLI